MTPTISIPPVAGSAAWTTCRSAAVSTATRVLIADAIATSPARSGDQALRRDEPRPLRLGTRGRPQDEPEPAVVGRPGQLGGLPAGSAQDHGSRRRTRRGRPQDQGVLHQELQRRLAPGCADDGDSDIDVDVITVADAARQPMGSVEGNCDGALLAREPRLERSGGSDLEV